MTDNLDRIRQGMAAGMVALSLGTAGCSHTMSAIFDAPEPPPMIEEVSEPAAPAPSVAPPLADAATVVAAPPAPVADLAPSPDNSLDQFLAGWRDAWAGRDIAAYLTYYHPAFKGNMVSPAQWRAARQRIIGRAGQIELELGQPEIRREGEDRAWLTFEQRYRSQALSDEGLKQLQLRKVDGRWLIEQEVFTPRKR
jgi:hypothetical protein